MEPSEETDPAFQHLVSTEAVQLVAFDENGEEEEEKEYETTLIKAQSQRPQQKFLFTGPILQPVDKACVGARVLTTVLLVVSLAVPYWFYAARVGAAGTGLDKNNYGFFHESVPETSVSLVIVCIWMVIEEALIVMLLVGVRGILQKVRWIFSAVSFLCGITIILSFTFPIKKDRFPTDNGLYVMISFGPSYVIACICCVLTVAGLTAEIVTYIILRGKDIYGPRQQAVFFEKSDIVSVALHSVATILLLLALPLPYWMSFIDIGQFEKITKSLGLSTFQNDDAVNTGLLICNTLLTVWILGHLVQITLGLTTNSKYCSWGFRLIPRVTTALFGMLTLSIFYFAVNKRVHYLTDLAPQGNIYEDVQLQWCYYLSVVAWLLDILEFGFGINKPVSNDVKLPEAAVLL